MVGSVWEVYPPSPQGCDGGQVESEAIMRIEKVSLTPRDATDIVIGAIEGGIGYWGECREYRWKRWYIDADAEFGTENYEKLRDIPRDEVLVLVREDADEVDPERSPNSWYALTIEELERGVGLALAQYPHLFTAMGGRDGDVEFDLDATGCDVIVQMTVFGKVIYG